MAANKGEPTPNHSLRERVLSAVRATPSVARPAAAPRRAVLLSLSGAISAALFVALGGVQATGRPLALVAETAGGTTLIAATALVLVLRWGGSMVGPPRGRLLAVVFIAPHAFLIWKVLCTDHFSGMAAPWSTRPGYRCLLLTLALALAPLIALFTIRRRTDPSHPMTYGAALGVAVGMGAAVLIDLWCPVGHLSHVIGGHVAPTLLLGALGVVLGSRVLAIRARP